MVGYWQYVWSTPGPRSDGYTRLALVPRISYYSTFYGIASFSGEIQLKNEVICVCTCIIPTFTF